MSDKTLSGKAHVEEPELIRRARAGDGAAWETLTAQHQEPVFRLAYLLTGDPDDAADVAQETFIRAYRSLARFDAERALRPWLLRIARNVTRNRWRALGRYVAALGRFGRGEMALGASLVDAEGETARRDEASLLREAVRRLPQADQEIIWLRHFLEMPVEETAAALDLPPGTVKSRLHRALRRLRQVVEQHYPALR